jgi:hypothetical protein
MSGMSIAGTRPLGRAMIVGAASCRAQSLGVMQGLGYDCAEVEDVYGAMLELCRRPLVYRSMILALASVYREELGVIAVVKKRFPHVDVYVSATEGRQSALAEAMRLGADGLVAEDGLHRTAVPPVRPVAGAGEKGPEQAELRPEPVAEPAEGVGVEDDPTEPVLTAEELAALLEDHEPAPRGG